MATSSPGSLSLLQKEGSCLWGSVAELPARSSLPGHTSQVPPQKETSGGGVLVAPWGLPGAQGSQVDEDQSRLNLWRCGAWWGGRGQGAPRNFSGIQPSF